MNSILIIIIFSAGIFYIYKLKKIIKEHKITICNKDDNYSKLLSQKKSSEIRTGQIAEQLAPFLNTFKYDPKHLHFIGMPIDYIYFGDDEVIIIEIKSGNSQLTQVQKNIKNLIDQKKIRWETHRIK